MAPTRGEWDACCIGNEADGSANDALRELGDVYDALERLPVPTFAIAPNGTIRWLNGRSRDLVGDRTGERFADVLDPASVPAAKQAFAQKLIGDVPFTEYEVTLRSRDGTLVRGEISSVALKDGESLAGVFGLVELDPDSSTAPASDHQVALTPRQSQVLNLLARGCSTEQMATELGIAEDTVRNHVRGILRRLGVHSRLEAVIAAHQRHLA